MIDASLRRYDIWPGEKWHDKIVKRIDFKYTCYALYESKTLQSVISDLVGTRYWLYLQNLIGIDPPKERKIHLIFKFRHIKIRYMASEFWYRLFKIQDLFKHNHQNIKTSIQNKYGIWKGPVETQILVRMAVVKKYQVNTESTKK